MNELDLSIVVPLLNEEESLPELSTWINRVMAEHGFTYEIIYVNDGSTDGSWEVIKQLGETDPNIKGISFRRNYGKSAALHEGFQAATGRVIITMDADLQDSPDEIPELYRMITQEHYDLVSGWKKKRYDPITKTIPTKLYNGVTRWVSGISLNDFNCGLKAYRRDVVKSIEVYGEMHRYIPVIAKWAGFKRIGEKEVQHRARKYGTTKFGLERFVNGFLDLMSITFVGRFGKKPMHFFGLLGTLFFVVGTGIALYLVGEKITYAWILNKHMARQITEQPLFFVALTAAILGSQMFLAGFLGELMSRNSPIRNYYHKKDTLRLKVK
ncbi:MAG: glycosyltransferase family 2 protein [Bacteroidetes bacterium]|nr:glycosyltransferase family 2 protein [Bacteroidota bacterium]